MPRTLPLVRFPPNALVHRFGTPASAPRSSALLRFSQQGWTISPSPSSSSVPGTQGKKEGWAVVGDAEGRRLAVETLLSRHRIHPLSPSGLFPYVNHLLSSSISSTETDTSLPEDTFKPIRHLAFARPPSSGEFTDFTARYGALLDEDRITFRESLSSLHPPPSSDEVERVAKLMNILHLLDLPSVSLSSGQTRRARIAAALLTKPVLLILEDPMAGLDVGSREEVSRVLGELNDNGIRLVLVLRGKGADGMPDWVTDVVEVRGGEVWVGKKEEYDERHKEEQKQQARIEEVNEVAHESRVPEDGKALEPVVLLDGVSVSYGEGTRKVLNEVSWTIKPGEKWHLIGANGSGKTTLLSLILGHHPRSYSLPANTLKLFSKPRRSIPSPTLRRLIGHTSPEIFASFPRGMGLRAYDAIGSGYEGVFSRRDLNSDQKERVLYLLGYFKDLLVPPAPAYGKTGTEMTVEDLAKRQFSHFTPSQQGLLLFLRAIVGRPRLLILDEPSQGMDEVIWERCKRLLDEEWRSEQGREMAVIVVSHYEDEVPWKKGAGNVLQLAQGVATVL
ncbi:hypothetical protein CI109_104122 [Kwoniella shandongensis]|uniref:Uncharacterized protein n=1 Tax=Kwoniella shandongensis TaxID=1734106 RepID=A0A5M6C5Q2_9TREE|nr:uncharacterized protein CI109_002966 [Kwoniella shandongensis]KAA5528805.1 hypothetical protein CI109_002966 [Kwoniella shandongensis]